MRTKLKLVKRYGGGGGTVSNIPDWAKPALEKVQGAAEAGYQSGDLGKVAGAAPGQTAAFTTGLQGVQTAGSTGTSSLTDQNARLAQIAQSGGYDTTALKNAAITQAGIKTAQLGQDYGARGVLGSARQAVGQGAQDAATAAQFATIDQAAAQTNLENKLKAEQGIGQNVTANADLAAKTATGEGAIGTAERGVNQSQLDAGWQGLQRYASTIYGNPARQQQSGGK